VQIFAGVGQIGLVREIPPKLHKLALHHVLTVASGGLLGGELPSEKYLP